jgi:uncharacterized protein
VKRSPGPVSRVAIAVLLAPVRLYQRLISPALPRRCKYEPTCSAYAVEAIRQLGPVRGTIVGAWRLARCNPFSHGGYDPLEARTLFNPEHRHGDGPRHAA